MELYNSCWLAGSIPHAWKDGVIHLIPREREREREAPDEPGNFRPIALTSCIEKVFTSILKHSFMIANGYMDTNVQKAFMHEISGYTEQSTKLAAALREPHTKHRSVTVYWLDLANAYDSVHHGLIQFSLQHYNAPDKLMNIVGDLYSDLQALITTPHWTSRPIPLKIGVYQGHSFSVVIFNTVMYTIADSMMGLQHLGYRFSQSQRAMHLLQYADDTCLISDSPAGCKKPLEGVERWLNWSGMKAKVSKCHSLPLQVSTAKTYDPRLTLYGQSIHFIGKEAIKYLGVTVQVPLDSDTIKHRLASKLQTMLEMVDKVPVTSHQKLLLYCAAICPRLNWDFMANDLMSWVKITLEAAATRFLKRWVELARPADPSRLYLPKRNGGLELPSISTLYKKQCASVACQILTSRDPIVRHTATLEIRSEADLNRPTHRPMIATRDI